MEYTDEQFQNLSSLELDECFAGNSEVITYTPQGEYSPVLAFKSDNTLAMTTPHTDVAALGSAILCASKNEECLFAVKCVRRLGWPGEGGGTHLACTTNLSPSIAITTRHDLGSVGSTVSTATDVKLCMCSVGERRGRGHLVEKEEGNVLMKCHQPLPQDTFIEEANKNRANIYDLALLTVSNSDNFLIPQWPELHKGGTVALIAYGARVEQVWLNNTYKDANNIPQVMDVVELFGGLRVPVVSPGSILGCNIFTISSTSPAIPSFCGGALIDPNSPAGTLIGIHIGGHKFLKVKKLVLFNLAITTAAPLFMYMYTMNVVPSLLPSLPRDHPRFALLKQYLQHVRDYIVRFLQNQVPELEFRVMDHLREMVGNARAWEDVLSVIEPLIQ